ncbi:MAG: DUF1036 domain-containing protein [Proteobacteria bacterium]|nr:DUF1036 domain-containing protein [Pseudomonadota bacterium]
MRHLLAALAFLSLTLPAEASFTVCNKSEHLTNVAVGRFNGTDWESEGWWTVGAHQCKTLLQGRLDARFYYLYASDGGAGGWGGNKGFCVGTKGAFKIVGRAGCAGRGYDRKGFFEVDTGRKIDFTQSLAD